MGIRLRPNPVPGKTEDRLAVSASLTERVNIWGTTWEGKAKEWERLRGSESGGI